MATPTARSQTGDPLPKALDSTFDQSAVIHDAKLGDLYPSTQLANVYYSKDKGMSFRDADGKGLRWSDGSKQTLGYALDQARADTYATVAATTDPAAATGASTAGSNAGTWFDDPTLGKITQSPDNPGYWWSDKKQDWFNDNGSGQIWWDKSQSWEDVGGSPAARATANVETTKPLEQIVSEATIPLIHDRLDKITTASDDMKKITDKLDPAMGAAVNQVLSIFGAVKDADGNTILPSMTDQRKADLMDAVAKVTAGNDKFKNEVTAAVGNYANELKNVSDKMYGVNGGAPGMVYDERLGGWLQDEGAKDPAKKGMYWDYTNQRYIQDQGNGKIYDYKAGAEVDIGSPDKGVGADYKLGQGNTLKDVLIRQVSGYQQGNAALYGAQTDIVAGQAAEQKDNLLKMIGSLKSAYGQYGSAESTELTKYETALKNSTGGLSDSETANLQASLGKLTDGLSKFGADKQAALKTELLNLGQATTTYVAGKKAAVADELTANRQAEAQNFSSKENALTNEVFGLRDNITKLHDSMADNLSTENKSQLDNLDAMIADAGQNINNYSDAQKSSLAAEIGKNLTSLEDDFNHRRGVLQDQLTQLKDTAGQQAHSVRADVQAELDKMNTAMDNLATVRETSAKTVQASINLGAQKNADSLAATQASKGFAGAGSFDRAAQARALIEGRQSAAQALGSAREQSAMDKVTGAQFATGQIANASEADAAAEENRINRQVGAGNTSLAMTTALENDYSSSKRAINDKEASDYRAINDQLAKGQLDLGNMDAGQRQTLLDYLATESRKLGDDQATGMKTVGDYLRTQGSANEVAHANSVLANAANAINETKANADEAQGLYYDINKAGAQSALAIGNEVADKTLANTEWSAAQQREIDDNKAVTEKANADLIALGRKDLADQMATGRLNLSTLDAESQKAISDALTKANATIKGNAAQAEFDANKFLTDQNRALDEEKLRNANAIDVNAANTNLKSVTDAEANQRLIDANAAMDAQRIADEGRAAAINNIDLIPKVANALYDYGDMGNAAAEMEASKAAGVLGLSAGVGYTPPTTNTTQVAPAYAAQPTLGALGAGLVSMGGNLAMAQMYTNQNKAGTQGMTDNVSTTAYLNQPANTAINWGFSTTPSPADDGYISGVQN